MIKQNYRQRVCSCAYQHIIWFCGNNVCVSPCYVDYFPLRSCLAIIFTTAETIVQDSEDVKVNLRLEITSLFYISVFTTYFKFNLQYSEKFGSA